MQLAEQYSTLIELSNPDDIGLDMDDYSATSVIGPEGGMVRVADPNSPIFGTCLNVPAGALDAPTRISIVAGDHTCSFGLAPSIKLLPRGLRFKRFVTLKVHLSDPCVMGLNNLKAADPAVYHYDETTDQWTHNGAARLNWQGNAVLCDLLHL